MSKKLDLIKLQAGINNALPKKNKKEESKEIIFNGFISPTKIR